MKQLLLVISCLFIALTYQGQTEIWGMTSEGGEHNGGVIFKTDASGNNLSVQHDFYMVGCSSPIYSSMMQASDGMLYGMTRLGGLNDFGLIFQYDPITTTYTQKFSFNSTNGAFPYGSLIQASNGKLYGMAYDGGTNLQGVLFEFDPVTNGYAVKFNFDGAANGANPMGNLMQASDGKLYGLTYYGGANNVGTLFCYNPGTGITTKKIDLNMTDGYKPSGSLIQGTDGKLYGLTREGGTNNYGTIFQYDPATNTYTKKIDFTGTSNGSMPSAHLFQASDGKMYGMTTYGGSNNYGTIFQYDPATNTFLKKFDFGGTFSGSTPMGGLVQAPDGMLYGMTSEGSTSLGGILFQYNPVTSAYNVKNDFQIDEDGRIPSGTLTLALDGKLYGMTTNGGINTKGVVFQYDQLTGVSTKKVDFYSAPQGRTPSGSLIKTADDKLYGLTSAGGTFGMGTLFQFDRATNTYTKKFEFDGTTNGKSPVGNLTKAADGKLYGMTSDGGNFYMGVLFQYDPVNNSYTKKIDFNGGNGRFPLGSLISATDGNLYGLTQFGGNYDFGVLFRYNVGSGTITNLFEFSIATGRYPQSSLLQASDGKLYGTTYNGGINGVGNIFQYDFVTGIFNVKYEFDASLNGAYSRSALIQANDGKLYGTTEQGGATYDGVLFQYDIVTDSYSKKFDFTSAVSGSSPISTLLQASDGNLYGMTQSGGTNNNGVLYQYNIITSSFTKKADFNRQNGKKPDYTALIEIDAIVGIKENSSTYSNLKLYPNPNNGSFTIDIKTKSQIAITNTLGEVVFNQFLEPGKQILNIQNKTNGIYFVTVTDSNGLSATKKVVLNR